MRDTARDTELSQGMPIYEANFILNELREKGKAEGALSCADLEDLDQLHYLGKSAVDHAAKVLGAGVDSHLLDIGSGLGGPARYIAFKYGGRVTGVELQGDLCQISRDLTERCSLSRQVQFIEGDFMQLDLGSHTFSGWLSLLAFLHIPNKESLFSACARASTPGSPFYIEDFYELNKPTEKESLCLREKVGCTLLQTREQYERDLRSAGFEEIKFLDMTEEWGGFVSGRLRSFQDDYEKKVSVHGEPLARKLGEFYQVVAQLFSQGNVGGVRITGRRSAH